MHDEKAESKSPPAPPKGADTVSDPQEKPKEVSWVRNNNFYWENSTFLVEDELFRAPRCQFIKHSETFRAMFTLPQADADAVEGNTDNKPIHLYGVTKIDFERLLNFMYPLDVLIALKRSLEEWTSIFKLSTMWAMAEIRDSAISHIMERHLEIEATERIALGRTHDVPALVRSGLVTLVNQDGGVTERQAILLGWEMALRIQWVRDKLLTSRYGCSCTFDENDIRNAVTSVFCGKPEWSFELEIFEPNASKSQRGKAQAGRRGGKKKF
ncbi:uncharacterized protein BT62DRAFT_608290 [Guyanagaster necrorhizus]|uniref:BTB domain-containing protein n=1 Tax=Guyanagaster necrorhizus TaxID=856835 RepID=A0A9P7VZW1_9AGAR|nr:uncharacterized protein BT62DRAFT_608290 [Guyanagaster necrorhizus MCA 3950]KAG7449815.1 hypothetical protein BT62DRAFT_608290 [Guyanagaster necrorhizus MCA 3950]